MTNIPALEIMFVKATKSGISSVLFLIGLYTKLCITPHDQKFIAVIAMIV